MATKEECESIVDASVKRHLHTYGWYRLANDTAAKHYLETFRKTEFPELQLVSNVGDKGIEQFLFVYGGRVHVLREIKKDLRKAIQVSNRLMQALTELGEL